MSRRLTALVVLLVVGACTQARDRAERERTAATPTSGAAAEKVTVPDLRHSTTTAADSTLRQTGLHLEVIPVGRRRCRRDLPEAGGRGARVGWIGRQG